MLAWLDCTRLTETNTVTLLIGFEEKFLKRNEYVEVNGTSTNLIIINQLSGLEDKILPDHSLCFLCSFPLSSFSHLFFPSLCNMLL